MASSTTSRCGPFPRSSGHLDPDRPALTEPARAPCRPALRSLPCVTLLQTHLRTQILEQLQQSGVAKLSPPVPPGNGAAATLWRRALNSMVAEYLNSGQMHYSLSVFKPECGLGSSATLSEAELLQLLHLQDEAGALRQQYQQAKAKAQGEQQQQQPWQRSHQPADVVAAGRV